MFVSQRLPMSAPRVLFLTFLTLACAGLSGCGTLNLFGDKASGSPASLGASIRVPLGGSDSKPHGDN